MAKVCPICGHSNPDAVDFCEDCGTDLKAGAPIAVPAAEAMQPLDASRLPDLDSPAAPVDAATSTAADVQPVDLGVDSGAPVQTAPVVPPPAAPAPAATRGPGQPVARLQLRRYGALTGDEVPVYGDRVVLGRFDQETGPVDIDLSGLPDSNYVSRRHAEMYRGPDGNWLIQDLGSSNGVFVRPHDAMAFGSRLSEACELHDGDEVAFGNLRFVVRFEA